MSDEKPKKKRVKPDAKPQQVVEDDPNVHAAAKEVEQAREQLNVAERCYRKLRDQATEKIERLQGRTLGDVVDFVVATTRKHPVVSLMTAGVLGYYLGRLFRR